MGDEHIISNLIKEPISNLNKYKCPPTKYDDLLTDDIFSYIDSLAMTQINPQGTISACQELSKLKVKVSY